MFDCSFVSLFKRFNQNIKFLLMLCFITDSLLQMIISLSDIVFLLLLPLLVFLPKYLPVVNYFRGVKQVLFLAAILCNETLFQNIDVS